MSEADLEKLTNVGQRLYVVFHVVSGHRILSSTGHQAVRQGISTSFGKAERGLNTYNSTQIFLTSIHFLWIYDYCLTFENEVRRDSHNSYHVVTFTQITYAWCGRKSWCEFAFAVSPRSITLQHTWFLASIRVISPCKMPSGTLSCD